MWYDEYLFMKTVRIIFILFMAAFGTEIFPGVFALAPKSGLENVSAKKNSDKSQYLSHFQVNGEMLSFGNVCVLLSGTNAAGKSAFSIIADNYRDWNVREEQSTHVQFYRQGNKIELIGDSSKKELRQVSSRFFNRVMTLKKPSLERGKKRKINYVVLFDDCFYEEMQLAGFSGETLSEFNVRFIRINPGKENTLEDWIQIIEEVEMAILRFENELSSNFRNETSHSA